MCAASCALCVRGRTVVKFHGSAEGAQWMKRKFWEMQSVSQNGNWQQLATGSGRQWIWIPYMRCAHKECVIFTNSRRQEIIKSNVLDIINESNYRCEHIGCARALTRACVCLWIHFHVIINHNAWNDNTATDVDKDDEFLTESNRKRCRKKEQWHVCFRFDCVVALFIVLAGWCGDRVAAVLVRYAKKVNCFH